jgi:hypothetical protein
VIHAHKYVNAGHAYIPICIHEYILVYTLGHTYTYTHIGTYIHTNHTNLNRRAHIKQNFVEHVHETSSKNWRYTIFHFVYMYAFLHVHECIHTFMYTMHSLT